uniref:peptide chain release factor N(5)-glutamine methyltransferase n=1 Tax=candidate division WOR-3 bacterium TaxID=2052148 RepID=A0A7C4U765_UNCW3
MRIEELFRKGREIIKDTDYNEYISILKEIYESLTGKSFHSLIMFEEIDDDIAWEILESIEMVKDGEPLQYITKSVKFMNLNLFVDRNVFIPRPETENLVEYAIENLKYMKNPFVCDLCTGSGAIAVSIAVLKKDAIVFATDISFDALKVAKENIKRYKLENRVFLIQGDIFKPFKEKKIFDAILSNPPYIPSNFIDKLPENVKKEPKLSLDGKEDGNYYIKKIIDEGIVFLKKKGFMIIEADNFDIDFKDKKYSFEILKDFTGKKRFIKCEVL